MASDIGFYRSFWQNVPLEAVMEVIIDYRGKSPRKTSYGVPLITAKIVKDGRILRPEEFIAHEDYDEWMRRGMPLPGDVVITTEAPLGEVAQLDHRKVALAQRIIALRGKDGVLDNTFLKFLLRSEAVQASLKSRSTGTTVAGIRQSELRQVPLLVPPFEEQRAIAHILGTLDDKIELNRKRNETLEAMAGALFQSWFVEFDPVRAKAEGRDPGLPADIAALFPDSFEPSELGEIPTSWSVKSIGHLVEFAYGKALKEADRKPGNVAVYGSNGQIGLHNEALVEGPGIIVGRKGNPGIVTWAPANFFAIDTTFYVVPKTECRSLYFLFYALKEHDLASLGADSAVPGLNRNMAYLSKQLVPPSPLLAAFDHQIRPLFDRIQKGKMESSSLAQIRDTLLPKLISGELRLKHTEQMMEEAKG